MGNLHLADELLLLALNDKRGSFYAGVSSVLTYGLIGAELLELILENRLTLENKCFAVMNPSLTNDTTKDDILTRVAGLEKFRKADYWVRSLARRMCNLKEIRLASLENRNLIQTEINRLWGIFSIKHYFQSDPGVKEAVKERLQNLVVYDATLEPKLVSLLILAGYCGLTKKIFYGEERRRAYRIAKDWMKIEKEYNDLREVLMAVNKVITEAQSGHTV